VDPEAVRKQLRDVLKSPGFARNQRLSRFLEFIVERHLEARDFELKESVIGSEVFGRKSDYDTKQDPIVRTEARRLRARLSEYHESAPQAPPVIIELPKGGYVPLIRPGAEAPPPQRPGWKSVLGTRRFVLLGCALLTVLFAALVSQWLGPAHRSPIRADSPAYDLYRRARASETRPACVGVESSVELFEEAIAKDPSFAPAYAGLASMEAARSGFDRFSPSERAAMIAKGWAAAKKSMQLAPALPDTYDALAMMQTRHAQWRQAEAGFRHSIALGPSEPLWRNHFALFMLLPLGRIQEAIQESLKAEELDPREHEPHYALSIALRAVGRFDDADFHCEHAAENEAQLSVCWADILTRQGKSADAARILETTWNDELLKMGAQSLGVVYARAGRRVDAERIAAIVPRPSSKALIFAILGYKDRTFELLDQMLPMGPTRLGRDLLAPEFSLLRGDARLQAIRGKLGLP
jgi:tetratricopeptide (TPR) repeat protein